MGLHLITGYVGKEHVTAADQGSYNAAMMGESQVVLERGNQFAASIISNNKVKVLDGDMIMQGRHIRLVEDTYEELNFDNGAHGYKRYDLIVARYTKDATTGIENTSFVVIKGTPSETTPVDPVYTSGDIIHDHALLNDFPLYRVPFDGLNMQDLVCLFNTVPTMGTLVTETRGKIDQAIQEMKENVVDNYGDALAVTADRVTVGCKAFQGLNNNLTGINQSLNQCFQSVSNGKSYIASAITDNGVSTAAGALFTTMAANIRTVATNKYNAGYASGYNTGYSGGYNTVNLESLLVTNIPNISHTMGRKYRVVIGILAGQHDYSASGNAWISNSGGSPGYGYIKQNNLIIVSGTSQRVTISVAYFLDVPQGGTVAMGSNFYGSATQCFGAFIGI